MSVSVSVIDGHDVGVGETPGGFCFAEKPCLDLLQLVVVVDFIESHGLDGHETLDRRIFSQVDKSHCTTSEFFQHLVAPEHAWCVANDR